MSGERNHNSTTLREATARSGLAPVQAAVFNNTNEASLVNGPVFGLGDFTVELGVLSENFNDYNGIVGGSANSFGLWVIQTSGKLQSTLRTIGDNTASDGALTAGKMQRVAYRRTGGIGTYFIDGKPVGTTADTRDYSVAITKVGGAGAAHMFFGALTALRTYNRALTDAEIVRLYETGVPHFADIKHPLNTLGAALLTGTNSDFSGAGSWTLGGDSAISGGKLNINNGYALINLSAANFAKGKRYRATIQIDSNTGQVRVDDGGANIYAMLSGTGLKTFEFVNMGTIFEVFGGTAVIDTITLVPVGLQVALDPNPPGNGFVWNDFSGHGAHVILPVTEAGWLFPDSRQNRIRGTTNTNGSEILFGTTAFKQNTQFLKIRARARTGTPTVSVGDAGGGSAQSIVANVALSQTWKDLTIVLANGAIYTAGNMNLTLTSNSTDIVEWDFSVEPVTG